MYFEVKKKKITKSEKMWWHSLSNMSYSVCMCMHTCMHAYQACANAHTPVPTYIHMQPVAACSLSSTEFQFQSSGHDAWVENAFTC